MYKKISISSFKNYKEGNNEKEKNITKYKEGIYFIDDLENIYVKENRTLPNSGFVFRKSMFFLDSSFIFMENRYMYEYLAQYLPCVRCRNKKIINNIKNKNN